MPSTFPFRPKRAARAIAVLASMLLVVPAHAQAQAQAQVCLRGVNVAGAEFGDLPGRYSFDYAYPEPQTLATLGRMGLSAIRLPIRWERIQPELNGPLDKDELERLRSTVEKAKAAGMSTVIDLHNYAYYEKRQLGTSDVTVAALADVWTRLATAFRRNASVSFGLMNEPYDIQATDLLVATNAAIAAIRATGARQLILVTGTAFSGAHSWTVDLPVGNNGKTMLGVKDPANNYAFEVHQYLDGDYSGRAASCERGANALAAIEGMTAWLTAHDKRAFLGEFGSSDRPECVAFIAQIIDHMNANTTRWVGWTAWAAGERWPTDYPFNIQPKSPTPPVLQMLAGKVGRATCGRVQR